jgi:hypothetical protein
LAACALKPPSAPAMALPTRFFRYATSTIAATCVRCASESERARGSVQEGGVFEDVRQRMRKR